MAQLTSRVHCFEPNPTAAAKLATRLPHSVTLHQVAASQTAGQATFFIPQKGDGSRAGANATIEAKNPVATAACETSTVTTARLDQVVTEPIGFIKIDVEGHERAVLEGAERILREDRPTVLVETTRLLNPAAPNDVFALMKGHGYEGLFLYRGRLTPLSAFREDVHQAIGVDGKPMSDHVYNFIFLPA